MILDSAGSLTQTNCALKSKEFTIKASPIAFDILSSRLYANPVLAIVRELLTNAYDSHKAAGKEDVPIKIILPSYMETNFIIRDYGLGLSEEDITQMYTTFFDSTKSNSNDFTGCFGLGSKTPFSYTSSFSVNSYFNGIKYKFIAVKKDGYPSIIKVSEEETSEPNGLEISIPTDKTNGIDYSFRINLEKYIQYIPEIKIDCNADIPRNEASVVAENISFYHRDTYNRQNRVFIKQGQNIYDVDEDFDKLSRRTAQYLQEICRGFDIVIEVPIGTVSITPSREHLANDETSTAIVTSILEKADDAAKHIIANKLYHQFSTDNTWLFQRAYNDIMTKKYLQGNMLIRAAFSCYDGKDTNTGCVVKFTAGTPFVYNHKEEKLHSFGIIRENVKTLIVLCPSKPTGNTVTKIKNIMNNYSELADYDVMFMPFDWLHGNYFSVYCDKSIIRSVKVFKDLCWILNNIPELNFDVETMTLNKFRKMYPNDRKARATKPKTTAVYIRKTLFTVHTTASNENTRSYGNSFTSRLSDVLDKCSIKNTILLPCVENNKKYNTYFTCVNAIYSLCATDFEFMRDYLRKILGVTDLPQTIHFLGVAKSSKKYFKDYKEIDIEDVKKYISNYGWQYRATGSRYTSTYENDLIETLNDFDSRILSKYKPKAQYAITNSFYYKKLISIKNIIEKYMGTKALNTMQEMSVDDFIGADALKSKRIVNIINNAIKRYMPADFLSFCGRASYRTFNGRSGKYEWRIRSNYRYEIFDIIKKEEKHVLLSRT